MGRLDCKEPSFIALKGLAKDADHFMTISDEDASDAQDQLHAQGYATSASGAAGVAGFLSAKQSLGISAESRILLIISEADPALVPDHPKRQQAHRGDPDHRGPPYAQDMG